MINEGLIKHIPYEKNYAMGGKKTQEFLKEERKMKNQFEYPRIQ